MAGPNAASLRAGDAELFRALILEHTPALVVWVRPYADGPDEADDLVQEVWQRVVARRGTYRATGSFRGWLYQVARTVCIDHTRRRASRERTLEHIGSYASHEASAEGPGVGESPRTLGARAFTAQSAVAGLPDRQREVVTLRILDGRSVRETAEMMGCAEGTVKAALSHALGNLRAHLGRERDAERCAHVTTNQDGNHDGE